MAVGPQLEGHRRQSFGEGRVLAGQRLGCRARRQLGVVEHAGFQRPRGSPQSFLGTHASMFDAGGEFSEQAPATPLLQRPPHHLAVDGVGGNHPVVGRDDHPRRFEAGRRRIDAERYEGGRRQRIRQSDQFERMAVVRCDAVQSKLHQFGQPLPDGEAAGQPVATIVADDRAAIDSGMHQLPEDQRVALGEVS